MVTTANNPSLFQRTQVGVQANFGTAVPTTKILKATSIEFDPNIETDQFTPDGNLFPSGSSIIQEWTEGDISGVLTYTEIIYLLSSAFGAVTPTGTAATGFTWKWNVTAQKEIVPVMLTIEKGGSVSADRVAAAVVNGLEIGWSRTDQIEIGGSILGKAAEQGVAMTNLTGPTSTVPTARVIPPQVSIFTAATYANLATPKTTATRMLRAFEAGISLDSLFAAVWPLNAMVTSFDGLVPTRPDSESSLLVQADAQGRAFLANTRNGDVTYLSIYCEGPTIPGSAPAVPYLFKLDMCVQVSDVDSYEDNDGVYAIPWTFQPMDDGVNPPLTFTVVNGVSAL